jgi:hypothetical protein
LIVKTNFACCNSLFSASMLFRIAPAMLPALLLEALKKLFDNVSINQSLRAKENSPAGAGNLPAGPTNMRRAGSWISEFGTVYGNFVFYRYRLPPAGKVVSVFLPAFPSFVACFLREVFGKCSGRLRDFPKPSRRNLEETPKKFQIQPVSGEIVYGARYLLQNPRKKNSRIRYRTLKSGHRIPPYLWVIRYFWRFRLIYQHLSIAQRVVNEM